MSVISKTRARCAAALVAGTLCCSVLPGCAAHNQSTVAQGKYYASGDPHYDEFFVFLYLLQVSMAEAPRIPEGERRNLAQALGLPETSEPSAIGQRLREEAAKLSRAGVHLRLDQSPSLDKPAAASAVLRCNARPKENPTAALLSQVELSGTNLLRSIAEMKEGEDAFDKLELMTIKLDSDVDQTFAQAHFGKQSEVKKNLADAHKMVSLMRARAAEVRSSSEQLLAELTKAVNTDDGSLGPAPGEAARPEPQVEANKADATKKPVAKPRPKAKPSGAPAAPAARPKPAPAMDSDAPAKPPAAASKAPAASRDFEP